MIAAKTIALAEEAAGTDRFAIAIVAAMQQPIVILARDLTVEFANPAFYKTFRVPVEETVSWPIDRLGNGQWNMPELRSLLDRVSSTGRPLQDYRVEYRFDQIGGRVFRLDATPLEQAAGAGRMLLTFSDITEAERDRFELEGQKEFAEKTLESVRDALLVLTWDLHVKSANQNFYRIFQVDSEETEGRLVYELGNGQWNIPRLRELLEQILPENHCIDSFEVEHDFEEIGHKVMLLNARRINHIQWILLAIQDVTEQRRNEGEQKLVMGELQHRVKNVLMNVRALARQTGRRAKTLDEFSKSFEGRLDGLARTQDLLLRGNADRAQIVDLIRFEVQALGVEEGVKFSAKGPQVELSAEVAHAMGMTLHELATNAAKYGALATEAGSINVAWTTEADQDTLRLRLTWRERGVQLTWDRSRKGFGTELIERSLPYLFGGSSRLCFHPDGVECKIDFLLPKERPSPASPGIDEQTAART